MRFCFCSDKKNVKGGATTLLITLIKELHLQHQEILLINYKDGLIISELKKSGISIPVLEIESLTKENVANQIHNSDIFIIQRFSEMLQLLFPINPLIIYYDINDQIGEISKYKFGWNLRFLGKKLIRKLLNADSLVFMDDTGLANLEREFGIMVDHPTYLPIPIEMKDENIYLKRNTSVEKPLRLTYIGRCIDWKMYPLKKILEDSLLIHEEIIFQIVVDDSRELNKFIDIAIYENSNIAIKVIEDLLPSEIDSFLAHNSDLHFGMGTTAIQGAALGIPTILMDYSRSEFPNDYTYCWLHDTQNFSLGKNLDKVPFRVGEKLGKVVGAIEDEKRRKCLSIKGFDYVTQHHSARRSAKLLIEYAKHCTFRLKDAKTLIPYYFKMHAILKKIMNRAPNAHKRVKFL